MNSERTATDSQAVVEVQRSELPLHCPTESMGLWNSHPRVYIPLEETAEASCPYCGTQFRVIDYRE